MIQPQLKHLVSKSVKTLGLAIKEVHGKILFEKVESVRLSMKKVRGQEADIVEKALNDIYKGLKKYPEDDLRLMAKSFSLMLELINACEAAFRSHRLEKYRTPKVDKANTIIFVFTSHPTEARSPHYLKLMSQVEDLLIEALESNFEQIESKLLHLMRIAVRINIANNERPQVKDEMSQIFHTVLTSEILNEQVQLFQKGVSVLFRTWVGGDKDGHPMVGHKTLHQSLELSRQSLVQYIHEKIKEYKTELILLKDSKVTFSSVTKVETLLNDLKKIGAADGSKVIKFKNEFKKLLVLAEKQKLVSPGLVEIKTLLWIYPALVLPLEIREDSSLIKEAVSDKTAPIALMLKRIKEISKGHDPKWYVRGFIISMCMTMEDYNAALHITKRDLGGHAIPIVPLFENERGLIDSVDILSGVMKDAEVIKVHQKAWGSRFEVMVGYSDSSKENGVLPSRLMVEGALFKLETFLKSKKLIPVFFHGSGGSTSRGGGTVQEQIAWWPQSAMDIFKVTIQGEMVQRNFNNHLIMRSQVGKILDSYQHAVPVAPDHPEVVSTFSTGVQKEYRNLIQDDSFRELIGLATPYQYLDLLRIGSRPTKRQVPGKFSLRAIPWILCWTQTRLLLPVWWGTGSAWKELSKKEKSKLQKFYKKSPLMQSYIKNLGFTIARIEFGVWNFHLHNSSLEKDKKKLWSSKITTEYELSLKFFREISGEKNYTWFRPWLSESIYFRSSMIHPLNVIQKIALERKDDVLLRETVTGIACGMLTTG